VHRVGDDARLAAGVGAGLGPQARDRHGQQRHRDALAGRQQHVELARRRQRRHLLRQVTQVVGGVAHGGHHDDDVVAGRFVATMRWATLLMQSASATDEPPYFCTTRPTEFSSRCGGGGVLDGTGRSGPETALSVVRTPGR
jgi:hypothetical protein